MDNSKLPRSSSGLTNTKKRKLDMQVQALQSKDIENDLLPILRGKVYHITTKEACAKIFKDGYLRQNQYGALGYSWSASENSYFRKRGYVSFVDLRNVSESELEEARVRYNYLCPPCVKSQPVYFILKESLYDLIVGWKITREDRGDIVVPYIEAGIKGNISLQDVSNVIKVNQ